MITPTQPQSATAEQYEQKIKENSNLIRVLMDIYNLELVGATIQVITQKDGIQKATTVDLFQMLERMEVITAIKKISHEIGTVAAAKNMELGAKRLELEIKKTGTV